MKFFSTVSMIIGLIFIWLVIGVPLEKPLQFLFTGCGVVTCIFGAWLLPWREYCHELEVKRLKEEITQLKDKNFELRMDFNFQSKKLERLRNELNS